MTTHVIFSARATRRHRQSTTFSLAETTERENTRNREVRCRDDPGKYIAKISATEGRFRVQVESEAVSRGVRRVPGAACRGGRARGPPGLPGAPFRLQIGLEFS